MNQSQVENFHKTMWFTLCIFAQMQRLFEWCGLCKFWGLYQEKTSLTQGVNYTSLAHQPAIPETQDQTSWLLQLYVHDCMNIILMHEVSISCIMLEIWGRPNFQAGILNDSVYEKVRNWCKQHKSPFLWTTHASWRLRDYPICFAVYTVANLVSFSQWPEETCHLQKGELQLLSHPLESESCRFQLVHLTCRMVVYVRAVEKLIRDDRSPMSVGSRCTCPPERAARKW